METFYFNPWENFKSKKYKHKVVINACSFYFFSKEDLLNRLKYLFS